MASKGYNRNAAQIKNKMKEMKKGYKDCKDHNSKIGNDRKVIDYYDDLDAILGLRPSVFLSVMMESMHDCDQALSDEIENDTFADNDIVPHLDFGFDVAPSAACPVKKKKKKKL